METFDYVIIGGGSAGCVIANRLSADPKIRVLLLEAGRSSNTWVSHVPIGVPIALGRKDMNWQYMAEPDHSRNDIVDMWPAGRMLGGGSALNGMMFVRGHQYDYDQWAAAGNTGWSFEEVLPYFKRMEDNERGENAYRGKGGPQAVSETRVRHLLDDVFIEAAKEIGIHHNNDLNGALAEGVGYVQSSQKNGRRASTASGYIDPIRNRKNLEVRLHSTVKRVLFNGKRASGVEFSHGGLEHVIQAAHGVIISAGALATPGVLFRSGLGCAKRLGELKTPVVSDLPGVGKNLQEHAAVRMGFHTNVPTLTSDLGPLKNIKHLLNYVMKKRGPLTMCIGHAQALIRSQLDLPAPNLQIIFSPMAFEFTDKGPRPYAKQAAGFAIGLTHGNSRGSVEIHSMDPQARPIIRYDLVGHPTDLQHLIEGCKITRQIMATKALAPYIIDERQPGKDVETDAQWEGYIRQSAFLMYHPCGTARMGVDAMAVVDPTLQVHGTENLWIADASIMPTITAGNINATCIMIGEKAADLIIHSRINQGDK
ncbi:MAG: GMC family oxidoreductase [Burkholderiales bacterium]|jgi:choline dehydrogenase